MMYTKEDLENALAAYRNISDELDGYNIMGNYEQFRKDGYPSRSARAFAYMPIIVEEYLRQSRNTKLTVLAEATERAIHYFDEYRHGIVEFTYAGLEKSIMGDK